MTEEKEKQPEVTFHIVEKDGNKFEIDLYWFEEQGFTGYKELSGCGQHLVISVDGATVFDGRDYVKDNSNKEITYLEASEQKDENGWFTFCGYEMLESSRQEYAGNNCIFAAGLISERSANPSCDVLYSVMEKDGMLAKVQMLRPDEVAAIARNLNGALWSHYYRDMEKDKDDERTKNDSN